jgi:hypothetical protein
MTFLIRIMSYTGFGDVVILFIQFEHLIKSEWQACSASSIFHNKELQLQSCTQKR